MQKRLWYLIPLVLLILCLLVPGILADRQGKSNETAALPVAAGDVTPPALPEQEHSGEAPVTPPAASISGATEQETTDADAVTDADAGQGQKPGSSVQTAPPVAPPAAPVSKETLTVNIAVVGQGGQLLFGPGSVKLAPGATAVDALAATGLDYATSKRFPDLVETIVGFSNKGQAGWLYQVNGEVPLVAATKKEVAANDRVLWWYSTSINNPMPGWEQLAP